MKPTYSHLIHNNTTSLFTPTVSAQLRHLQYACTPIIIKADSHTACRAHAVPLTCRTAKAFRLCLSPLNLHSATMPDSDLLCHAHAMLRPRLSSQGHGKTRPSSDGLWTTSPRSASSGYHAEFHEGCYQNHNNLRRRWPA